MIGEKLTLKLEFLNNPHEEKEKLDSDIEES